MAWHNSDQGIYYYKPGESGWPDQRAIDNGMEVYYFFTGNVTTPWTTESIAAMAGNMTLESTMNPFIRAANQSGAFGLVQWVTFKSNMISWANSNGLTPTDGMPQCSYIELERQGIDTQWLGRGDYSGVTFSNFAYNSGGWTLAELTKMFWACFERSAEYQTVRETYANVYYQLYTGTPPGPTPSGGLPIYILKRKKPWYRPGGRKYINA